MRSTADHKITTVLFILLMMVLILPAIQQITKIVVVGPLQGAVEHEKKPRLTWENWADENFQSSTEKYLNQQFGFRNWFVRLHNQVEYSLFKKSNAHSVIVGKKGYLYEENYIKSYYGRDFIGDSLMPAKVKRQKFLQDTLASLGKELVIVITPGKGWFYPEYIPDYLRGEKTKTNYETFIKDAARERLQVIDFNAWFMNQKNVAPYPLYPKTGIHWSRYAMNLVIDSLLHYIEKNRNIDLADVSIGKVRLSKKLIEPDRDIEDGSNLLFDIPNQPMAYADITYNDTAKNKPSVMVIADSFFWGLLNKHFLRSCFNGGEFCLCPMIRNSD